MLTKLSLNCVVRSAKIIVLIRIWFFLNCFSHFQSTIFNKATFNENKIRVVTWHLLRLLEIKSLELQNREISIFLSISIMLIFPSNILHGVTFSKNKVRTVSCDHIDWRNVYSFELQNRQISIFLSISVMLIFWSSMFNGFTFSEKNRLVLLHYSI